MKVTLIMTLCLLAGCGSISYTKYASSMTFIGKSKPASAYSVNADSSLGGELPNFTQKDQKYEALGFMSSALGPKYVMINSGDKKVYVQMSNLFTECQYVRDSLRGEITTTKAKGDIAWGRAVVFVQKNSDMKIQTQSEFIIDTYNVSIIKDKVARGFTITKEPNENGTVKFTITCHTNNEFDFASKINLELDCAYYMLTGQLCD